MFRSLKHWIASLSHPADHELVEPPARAAPTRTKAAEPRIALQGVDDSRRDHPANKTVDITPTGYEQLLKLTVTTSSGFGPQASRLPHSQDRSAKDLPGLTYGYPDRPVTPPKPAPFAECKIYYGQYADFDAAQKRYYLWWRYNFDAGVILPTTDTYLFVAGYEAPVFASTLKAVHDRWVALWRAYPDARSFRSYSANWVESLRSMMGLAIYDDITQSLGPGQRRLDAAVSAGVPPDIEDLIALCPFEYNRAIGFVRKDRLRRTMDALRRVDGPDRVLAAARSNARQPRMGRFDTRYFSQFPTRVQLMRLFPPNTPLGAPFENVEAKHVAENLINEALALLASPMATDRASGGDADDIIFAETPSREKRVPIHRDLEFVAALAPDTIDGLKRTLTLTADDGMLTLLALVLHLSDVKPYVEGLIAYSSEGRGYFTIAADALGLDSGLGAYRRSFYDLTDGLRAPWILEPQTLPAGMRMGVARARFIRGLQRALLGSDPRGEVCGWLCLRLAERRSRPVAEVIAALERATGVEA